MSRTLLAALAALVVAAPAQTQEVATGVGEIRKGEFWRQDVVEVDARFAVGANTSVRTLLSARHGKRDNANVPMPTASLFLSQAWASVGPASVGTDFGAYAVPWEDYRTWRFLAGPRVELDVGLDLRLHASYLWQDEGWTVESPSSAPVLRDWRGQFTMRLDYVWMR